MKKYMLLGLLIFNFLTLSSALAEVTASTQAVWGRIFDIDSKPIAGMTGNFCMSVPFSNGEVKSTCEPVVANAFGEFWVAPVLEVWKAKLYPLKGQGFYLEVGDHSFSASATVFNPVCEDHARDEGRFYDTTCLQHTNLDFYMPFKGQCKGKFEKDAIGRLVCVKIK